MKKSLLILLLMVAIGMSAQEVPTFFPRKFLMEHFTSENCNECPQGMKNIVDYLENQTTSYIWVSHHAVYGTDEYTTAYGDAIASQYGIRNVPTVMINRSKQQGILILDAKNHLSELEVGCNPMAEASVVITHSYDPTTRQLDVQVCGEVGDKDVKAYLLSILIKENGLVGKQADQYTSWKRANWLEYMHTRVVRDFITGTFGDTVYVNDQSYSHSASYTLNKDWVAENCCVVAYLTPLDKSPIINAEQVAVMDGTAGGEQYDPYGITEAKGPNTSISFDSISVKRLEDDVVEMQMISNKTMQSYAGICKQVAYVYVNTRDSVVAPGVYRIQEGKDDGTITAGYRVDEEETLGGSRLVYALSADLKNGIVSPIHMWRMSSGEMAVDADGNISLNFTTYNGTSVTATAVYDFSPAATGVEDIESLEGQEFMGAGVMKVLREGQLLIERQGQWYTVWGYRL
jgi:hypothetical protein